MEIILATTNRHKWKEFQVLLSGFSSIQLNLLSAFPSYTPPEETKDSFCGNARLKALHAASFLNCWVLADDSGLVVPALHGEPGIFSARYAGIHRSTQDNNRKLLLRMKDLSTKERKAYYECCLVLASPHRVRKIACATCHGRISKEERGILGFGYDPIFIPEHSDKTFGELGEEQKNKISHRKKAVQQMVVFLQGFLREPLIKALCPEKREVF